MIACYLEYACDAFVFWHLSFVTVDCALHLSKLSGASLEAVQEDITYVRACTTTVYAGLGVAVKKSMDMNVFDHRLPGFEQHISRRRWVYLCIASMLCLLSGEVQLAKLGLFKEGSVLYIRLWHFLSPYYWIKRSVLRIYVFLGLSTVIATYLSRRDLAQRRLHFSRLWQYVPLPILDLGTVSIGMGKTSSLIVGVFSYAFVFIIVCWF